MTQVLSVLLAAAMVMGMSVSAMADKVWGAPADAGEATISVSEIFFNNNMWVEHKDGTKYDVVDCAEVKEDEWTFIAGDTLYFLLETEDGLYSDEIDASWVINIKDVDYVEKAYFTAFDKDWTFNSKLIDEVGYNKAVAVQLDAEYDDVDTDDIDFYFYIAEKDEDTHKVVTSKKATVHYLFDNWSYKLNKVDFDFVNEVDVPSKWTVAKEEKGVATFSFDDEAFFEVKMISEESVIFNAEIKDYVKAIEKAFDYEASYVSYNFKGESDEFYKEGVLLLPADEETFIYAWDGEEFVEIKAEYVEDYKFQTGKKVDGWKVETNELGWYVVSDTEAVIEAVEEEAPVEAEKANPETGAADFVGAAVAMAVVSVAAAGALALKK